MKLSVKPHHVWKNKPVRLKVELPLGFGNKRTLPPGARGYVLSNGFEQGMLQVLFDLYAGKEKVQFNVESAEKYLESDIMLQKPESLPY